MATTDYLNIDADTVPLIVSKFGANTQEQAWCAKVAIGAPMDSQFGPVMDNGAGAAKPIKMIFDFSKLHGQVVNFQSRAPLGSSPGTQGSLNTRVGSGEDAKINMWQMFMGVHFQAGKYNSIALAQTILGQSGPQDTLIQNGLKDLFKNIQGRTIEATLLQRATARNTLYCGGATSIDTLGSANTFQIGMGRKISALLASNMAEPIAITKPRGGGVLPMYRYYVTGTTDFYDDLESQSDYVNTLALSRVRGDANELVYGDIPDFGNTVFDKFTIRNDTSDGPKGTIGSPKAFLGAALAASLATGTKLYGGGSAAAVARSAAARAPFPFFENWPAAQFQKFESTKRAATTGTELYALIKCAAGGFRMVAYQVSDGNTLTLTKALVKSTTSLAGAGFIETHTVGGVTADNATTPWLDKYISDTAAIGDMVVPCNRLGQPYTTAYGLGNNAVWTGYGMFQDGNAMGKRTIIDGKVLNHDVESEIGLAMNWGVEAQVDANGMSNGFAVIYGAFNLDGMPFLVA